MIPFQRTSLLLLAGCGSLSLLTGCITTVEQKLADGTVQVSRYYPWDSPQKKQERPAPSTNLAYAKLLEQRGKHQEARATYEKVLKDSPKTIEAIIGLAKLDQIAGRTKDAELRLQEAQKLEPRSPIVMAAIAQYHADEQRLDEAAKFFEEALAIAPDEQGIRYQYAVALAKAKHGDEALAQFQRAVGPAAGHYNLGLILHEQGQLEASEHQFVLALMKDPKLDQARVWLDDVRQQIDHRENQRTHLAQNSRRSSNANVAPATALTNGRGRSLPPRQDRGLVGQPPVFDELATGTSQASHSDDRRALITPQPQQRTSSPATVLAGRDPTSDRQGHTARGSRPASSGTANAATAQRSTAPAGDMLAPPPGLTPQQREQWYNQQSDDSSSAPQTPTR